MYDVANKSSFESLDSWLDEIKHDIGSLADFDNVVFMVCANKVCYIHCELKKNLRPLLYLHYLWFILPDVNSFFIIRESDLVFGVKSTTSS